MDPIFLQKQIRDNNQDLLSYCQDIKSWAEDMKRNEAGLKDNPDKNTAPTIRNKPLKKEKKKHSTESEVAAPAKKIPKDFSYWEKFDADAECSKLDKSSNDESSDLSDEIDEDAIEQAQEEKENGNKFVKASEWQKAIKCYTNAINFYSYDATFFCNRALCHLKLGSNKNAEADCTVAINLDKKYVKAMYRRALARQALKQLKEAKQDLENILQLEPQNKESQKLFDQIEKELNKDVISKEKLSKDAETNYQRPISKFTASRGNIKQNEVASTSKTLENSNELAFKDKIIEKKKPAVGEKKQATVEKKKPVLISPGFQWPAGDDVDLVLPITKLPKERSKKSLKHIQVKEVTLSSIK